MERKGEESPVFEVKPETCVGQHHVIHQTLSLPCNDLSFKYNRCDHKKPERVSKRSKSPKTPPDPSPRSSPDEEPDGILTFSPVQDKEGATNFKSFSPYQRGS